MKKSTLLMIVSVVLALTLSLGGTLAYLQDSDSDVNVMTLGNVYIEQHEYERELNADGTYKTEEFIAGETSYVLKEFTQGKPLYPAIIPNGGTVGGVTWNYDDTRVRMTQVDSYGTAQVFNTPNAVDKFVTVENTGKSDAYVRTLIALEVGTAELADDNYPNQDLIMAEIRADLEEKNADGHAPWTFGFQGNIEVDGNKYLLLEMIYTGAKLSDGTWRHANGVLPAGDTTYPNLCQVYMASRATNEDVEAIDGNKNGTYDILVVSQAVQAMGFTDAKIALDTAFGAVSAESHPWIDMDDPENKNDQDPDDVEIPLYVSNANDMIKALEANADFYLANDITLPSDYEPVEKFSGVLDGNGKTITFNTNTDSNFALISDATDATIKDLTIAGEINGGSYAAGIAVEMYGGLVENCVNNADISAGRAAGLVAWIAKTTEVKDCVNTGDITGAIGAAGIANRFVGTMTNCVNEGNIVANGIEPAGGLVSIIPAAATFDHCVNTGDVKSTADDANASAAGILGQSPSKTATMNYCVNTGNITAEQSYASGIVYTLYGSAKANYCYNAGAVNGADGAGGIAAKAQFGTNDTANYCLNAGVVTSNGTAYQNAPKASTSYYYSEGNLFANNNVAAATDAALIALNGGSDASFFTVVGDKITVK